MSSRRYVCIHGHFYQPPRENPWLEIVESQESATPYHDWNERITVECYAPNRAARILGEDKLIRKIVNNYERMSFNFGPTLLAWMVDAAPDVYQAIIEADAASVRRFSGHGSAMAQAYSHSILPLANRRDKKSQIRWGLADFVNRYSREPEGMWLPETAVDLETLDLLALNGIRFTVLAPSQAKRFRGPDGSWRDASREALDTRRAYRVELPSGGSIAVFFYDGALSQAVAFEHLLSDGERFAQRLKDGFGAKEGGKSGTSDLDDASDGQLVHLATDGETYGHHHRYGDMALAYALESIDESKLYQLTNYGEYLERFPPDHTAEIVERSAWSCAHGVGRWQEDCGCKTGGKPDWNQRWRAPLRQSLDWLRDELASRFESRAGELLNDPWSARDRYIDVILDRSIESNERFLAEQAIRPLSGAEAADVFKLMELQRAAMLMYTSCGWFFDEPSGIETVQILAYAGRALQLADELFADADLEEPFLNELARAKSNLSEEGDGRQIYETWIRPMLVDLEKVVAHFAVASLFNGDPEELRSKASSECFELEMEDSRTFAAGRSRLVVGRATIRARNTLDAESFSFGALRFGGHNVQAGVRSFAGDDAYEALLREVAEPFQKGDFTSVIRVLDLHFGKATYSLQSLFRDQRRAILDVILKSALDEADAAYSRLHENYAATMRFLKELGITAPEAFANASRLTLNSKLRRAFDGEGLDLSPEEVRALLDSARSEGVRLDSESLSYAWRAGIERVAAKFFDEQSGRARTDRLNGLHRPPRLGDLKSLSKLDAALDLAESAPFDVDLWRVQNQFYRLLYTQFADYRERAERGDENARQWLRQASSLGAKLSFRVPPSD